MTRPGALLGLCLLVLGGCGEESPPVDASQVLELLTDCPEGSACEKVADGQSRVTVRACIKDTVREPLANVSLNLTLSSGRWENQDASVRTVSAPIQGSRCFSPAFITGTDATRVRVDAEVAGFRQFVEFPLQPAPLKDIALVPAPTQPRAGQETALQVQVLTAKGLPTQGTTLTFSVEGVEPATAQAVIWPMSARLDANGAAVGQLLLSSDVARLTVRVKATAPDVGTGTSTVERTFPLTAAP